jgi:hydroxymethylglutaryl-CoA lyase
MADTSEVVAGISRLDGVRYAALTPNMQGFEAAMTAGVNEVAVFAAATEAFSQKNINCSIRESLDRFRPVCEAAQAAKIPVRGYISCVLGCPYEGGVDPKAVGGVAGTLMDMGCYEISLGDTIGVGTPADVRALIAAVAEVVAAEILAVHFHDTYGQALANILTALEMEISVVDSAVGGLGGCPYAEGATGNVASEDVLYMLNGLGLETGIALEDLVAAGRFICGELGRPPASKVSMALSGSSAP